MISEQIAQIVVVCPLASYGPAIVYTDVPEHMIGKILGIQVGGLTFVVVGLPWICNSTPP